ncbi:MAG: NUDIX domain-containing protein [Gemmatimonadaceae bacterium]|nr:NUDIX domain-containing protein [Gemmatimonadaceae bacterium]
MTRARTRRERSAGGVVFRRDGSRTLVLVICDSRGHWGFPKGHVEPGEAAEEAAIREVCEETGVNAAAVVGQLKSIRWRFSSRGTRVSKTCHFFALVTEQVRTTPQRKEGITACRWVSPDVARRLLTWDNARGVLDSARAAWDARCAAEAR